MVYPYRGEDMECAAVARATMIANSQPLGAAPEDSLGIYSTSEDEGEFSHAPDSVSTSRLVGTFYNPNNPSDTNSMVSSLQDELSNSPPPDHNQSKNVVLDHPWKETPEQALGFPSSPRRRRVWVWGFLLALSLLIGIAVSMGVIIGVNHEKHKTNGVRGPTIVTTSDEDNTEAEDNGLSSENSTSNAGQNSKPVVSNPPSAFHTPRPNSTTQSINAFVRSLPSYTQQALETPTSPQQRSLNWLTKDPALTSYSAAQLLQRFVLKTFYFSTNGGNDELDSDQQWLVSEGWGSPSLSNFNEHECQWFTTYEDNTIEPACNDQGTFTVLSVNRNNLRGSLPRELALLTSLRVLDVELNSIQSEIPSELGLLTNLERLLLGSNDFTGPVPSELGQLSQLVDLELENNVLSSSIPSHLGQLGQLVNLTLDDNQFSDSIPTEMGLLTSLENLLLHRNSLTGSLPTEIGQWRQLQSLSFRNCLLSGSLPTELGLLTNLGRLWGYQNILGGSIPTHLGQATRLTQLSLSRNRLIGNIPSEFGQLSELKNLWLFQNHLSGALPSELGLLTDLELLPVRDNEITGSVPEEVCAIAMLEVTVDCLEVACSCECACADAEEENDDLRG